MAGKQMAFQMSEYDYREALKLFVTLREAQVEVSDYIAAVTDEKKRQRLQAALLIAVKCDKEGTDPLRVRKIVCWRNAEGKPGAIEVEIAKPVPQPVEEVPNQLP